MHPGEKHLAQLRRTHWVLLAIVVLMVVAAEMIRNISPIEGVSDLVLISVAAIAILDIAVCIFLRNKQLSEATEILRRARDDSRGWIKWRAAIFHGLISAATLSVFGFFVRVAAGNMPLSVAFYVVSILLLLVWTPRLPD